MIGVSYPHLNVSIYLKSMICVINVDEYEQINLSLVSSRTMSQIKEVEVQNLIT